LPKNSRTLGVLLDPPHPSLAAMFVAYRDHCLACIPQMNIHCVRAAALTIGIDLPHNPSRFTKRRQIIDATDMQMGGVLRRVKGGPAMLHEHPNSITPPTHHHSK